VSGRILALRRDALEALQDVLRQTGNIAAALDEISHEQVRTAAFRGAVEPAVATDDIAAARSAAADIAKNVLFLIEGITSIGEITKNANAKGDFETKIKRLSDGLKGTFQHHLDEINQARDALIDAAGGLKLRISKLHTTDIPAWLAGGPFPPDLAALGNEALAYATHHDRRFAALVLQAAPAFNRVKDSFEQAAATALLKIIGPLVAVHDAAIAVLKAVGKFFDTTSGTPNDIRIAEFLRVIISPDVVDAFTNTQPIEADRTDLQTIQSQAANAATRPQAFKAADDLRKRWALQEPALARNLRELARVIESLAHGDLSAIVDLGKVRDLIETELKKALAAFIPTQFETSYAWTTDLSPLDPVFSMVQSGPDDLTLSAHVSINLLIPGSRSVIVKGTLKPFKINILSEGPNNFLTLIFKEASFQSVNGGRPDLSATVENVIIGTSLEFIKLLQSFLSYGDDSGFYVRPTIFPLGIEAGFEYSEDIVPLGGLILYNVGFSVSANLPFQDRDARFRFALSSADAPLIISYPPYGGGGFVALTANGREFVEVECSFEFGAIVGLSFGPLSAVGRVMAGIYFRQAQGGGALIKGFVHAVGEGSIACFSISVNIEVAITHYPDGHMEGSSTYRFSFKVSIAEITYEVTAKYSVSGGGGGGGTQALIAATAKTDGAQLLAKAGCHPSEIFYKIIERIPPKTRRWRDHIGHFDLSLLESKP
jgi:hypothetical protein